MILLITGASHTGKTLLAQNLLEMLNIPYLSIDHLKMGLIRSHQTPLKPDDDDELTAYLWPIVREMIKTAIENGQNLVIEGSYIPSDWKKDLDPFYLKQIFYCCLVMSKEYIQEHFNEIQTFENRIEHRKYAGDLRMEELIKENQRNLAAISEQHLNGILIEDRYSPDDLAAEIARQITEFQKRS